MSFWSWLASLFEGDPAKQPAYKRLRRFFGEMFSKVETHQKDFPGYDLASINFAISSILEEASKHSMVGSIGAQNLHLFLEQCKVGGIGNYQRQLVASPPTYQRMPIDAEEEVSVISECLYLAELWQSETATKDAEPATEKIAILVATSGAHMDYDGMETDRMPVQTITVSIACRNREVANRFFADLNARRRRLSVFRGKVIDPALTNGAILTVGFRPIKRVREHDLVLTDNVKKLLQSAIVGFYRHSEKLEKLGIDMKRGILLHGPPGCGKTSISLYLAGLLPKFTVCFVSGQQLLYPRELCKMARYLQPSMIVFEDIDLVAQARDANGLATVLGELMNQIDGCDPAEQVLFMMTTNSLDRLESAMRNRPGRVDQIIEIPLPDREARDRLLRYFGSSVKLAKEDLGPVLEATADMTPAMLKEIVKRAAVYAVERDGQAGSEIVVEESDLLLAAEQVQALREPLRTSARVGFGIRDA